MINLCEPIAEALREDGFDAASRLGAVIIKFRRFNVEIAIVGANLRAWIHWPDGDLNCPDYHAKEFELADPDVFSQIKGWLTGV